MKKKIIIGIILIIVFLAIGYLFLYKTKNINYQIQTIIEDEKGYVISITYPKINISKLDQKITKYIDTQKENFKKDSTKANYLLERNELNIDFDYSEFNNRYINIVLKTSNYNGKSKQTNYNIFTVLYDLKKKEFINIWDLFNDSGFVFSKIKDAFLQQHNITISKTENVFMIIIDTRLITYTITDNIYSVSLSLIELSPKLTIKDLKTETDEIPTEKVTNIIDPNKPVVAITFDDGPSQYTEEIIEILEENDCNATFFVLGNKVEAYQDVIRESIKNGNEIGNHSYNHKWLSRLSTDEIIDQITKTQNILKETIGYTPTHLRPTYGSVNQRIRKNTDLTITLWTIDTKDWKIKNIDRIVEKAIKNIEDGDIILMHDIFERSSEALKKIIPILKEKGFQLVTVSELEEVKLLRTKF